METEKTLAMVKPDGLHGNYTDRIKLAILKSGFRILKEIIMELHEDRASRFCAEHLSRSFLSSLVKYMTRYVLNLWNVAKFPLEIVICIILYVFVRNHEPPQWYDIVQLKHNLLWFCFWFSQKASYQWRCISYL